MINTMIATGNLGNNAESFQTQSGSSIVSFSIPVSSGFGANKKTNWVKCKMFGKRGESVLAMLNKVILVNDIDIMTSKNDNQSQPVTKENEIFKDEDDFGDNNPF